MADTVLQVLARQIDSDLILPLRQQLIGRTLAATNPTVKGDGVFEVVHQSLNELGEATISYSLPKPSDQRDSITATSTPLKIPVLEKGFEISRADYDVWKANGTPIDTTVALSAAQVVGVKEDNLIVNGWAPDGSTTKITGLYAGAGNSFTTNLDFGTAGYPTDAVAGALALIETDYALADAYQLLLNPVQRNELRASRNTAGVREEPEVLDMLNTKGGSGSKVVSTSVILAGTGLLVPIDPARRFLELVVPRDYRTTLGVDSRDETNSPIYGRITCMTLPKIKQSNGLCSLTQI